MCTLTRRPRRRLQMEVKPSQRNQTQQPIKDLSASRPASCHLEIHTFLCRHSPTKTDERRLFCVRVSFCISVFWIHVAPSFCLCMNCQFLISPLTNGPLVQRPCLYRGVRVHETTETTMQYLSLTWCGATTTLPEEEEEERKRRTF